MTFQGAHVGVKERPGICITKDGLSVVTVRGNFIRIVPIFHVPTQLSPLLDILWGGYYSKVLSFLRGYPLSFHFYDAHFPPTKVRGPNIVT